VRAQNIVCFAKEWSESPTSNNHVMRTLAAQNRVVWLNSIATRTPKISSARDMRKVSRKIRSFGAGPVEAAPGLFVHTPLVLPLHYTKAAVAVNSVLLRATVARLRRRLAMPDFQLWTFLPTAAPYVGRLGESVSVYYCTDEWSQFTAVDRAAISKMEAELCAKVDVVFAASASLVARKRALNPETHLASHGVDRDHFAAALDPALPVAPELAGIKGPVLGFFGLVEDWIDVDLLADVAARRPDWTVAVIGPAMVDVSRLAARPNVMLLGRRPYADLPRYAKGFSVGLCPFKINELTANVNPIKLREYLSAGLPVVSTDIPECRVRPEWGRVARTAEEFTGQVEAVLGEDTPARRRERSEAMKAETWERKVDALGAHVLRVAERKKGAR
jgi:glycosyltransferase involved in cell wall biosynthesis